MVDSRLRIALVFAVCVLTSARGDAAEIRVDPSRPGMGAVLEGKIDAGDFEKFKKFVLENGRTVEIYLASPGGNLVEALNIGNLARRLKLSTVVPSKTLTNYARELAAAQHGLRDSRANYMCASACFFIFVAGIHRRSDSLEPAILGIHRPSLSGNDIKRLEPDRAAAIADQVQSTLANYLTIMDVPARYAEAMYSVPSGRIRWVRNVDFDADLEGFIPELREQVDAKCVNHTNPANEGEREPSDTASAEQAALSDPAGDSSPKQPQTRLDCERDFEVEMAVRARQDFVESWNTHNGRLTPKAMPSTAQ